MYASHHISLRMTGLVVIFTLQSYVILFPHVLSNFGMFGSSSYSINFYFYFYIRLFYFFSLLPTLFLFFFLIILLFQILPLILILLSVRNTGWEGYDSGEISLRRTEDEGGISCGPI